MSLFMRTAKLGAVVMLGASMSACGSSWKEEVLLHDGSTIVVERSVKRGGRHEIGQQPPIKEQQLNWTLPGMNETITWESEFAEYVGYADLMPLAIDASKGTVYVVATPVGCTAYNKWGRPNPPYVVFKKNGKEWQRIALQELPVEIKQPNLIISSPDNHLGWFNYHTISANEIHKLNSSLTQPEYRGIVREPLSKERIKQMCDEMVLYKGYWIVKDSPTGRFMVDQMIERNSRK